MEVSSLVKLNVVLVTLTVCIFVYHAESSPTQFRNLRRFESEKVEEGKRSQDSETDSSDEAVLEARQGQCHRSCSKRCVAKEGELTRCRTTCTKRCLVGDEDKDEDETTTTTTSSGSTVPSAATDTSTDPSTSVSSPTVPTSARRNRIRTRNQLRNKQFDVVLLAPFEETGIDPVEEETDEPGSSVM